MQTHPFDKLTLNSGATFIFTPCPGTKGVEVNTSVNQLKNAGAQAILTLMYDKEIEKLGASSLQSACDEIGINWFQLPILDDAAPNNVFEAAFNNHLSEILNILNNQGTIAVHCKGGSGRTGLVIGLLMLELGINKHDVINQVQSIRPKALTNPTQLSYFNNFKHS
jgi:protein-tyrosine phosphatase